MSQSRQEEVRKLLCPPECWNQSPETGNGTSVRKEGDRKYLRATFVSCGCAFGLLYPFPLPLTTVQDYIWALFSPLPLFISFTEAIILQSELFRSNPILPFYLAVSFFWPYHSWNAMLWTKTQRSFLFVRFWLCIPSLSLAFLLSVALTALFFSCGASGTSPRPPAEIFLSLKHDLVLDLTPHAGAQHRTNFKSS